MWRRTSPMLSSMPPVGRVFPLGGSTKARCKEVARGFQWLGRTRTTSLLPDGDTRGGWRRLLAPWRRSTVGCGGVMAHGLMVGQRRDWRRPAGRRRAAALCVVCDVATTVVVAPGSCLGVIEGEHLLCGLPPTGKTREAQVGPTVRACPGYVLRRGGANRAGASRRPVRGVARTVSGAL
jgi:hypothetical protein